MSWRAPIETVKCVVHSPAEYSLPSRADTWVRAIRELVFVNPSSLVFPGDVIPNADDGTALSIEGIRQGQSHLRHRPSAPLHVEMGLSRRVSADDFQAGVIADAAVPHASRNDQHVASLQAKLSARLSAEEHGHFAF